MRLKLISLMISLPFSPLVLALDLSMSPDSLIYECKEIRRVGLQEQSLGEVNRFDDSTGEITRYQIRKYDYLKKQAAPLVAKVKVNRPGFTRHFPASRNTAFHILPVTSRH